MRRLAYSAADRDTLMTLVRADYDPAAYAESEPKTNQKTFENDLRRLREWGVDIYFDGEYHLTSYGEFSPVALGEEEQAALAFLTEIFTQESPNGAAVQQLLRRIADWLPTEQRESLPHRRQRWRLDLGRKDEDVIDPVMQERIEQAIGQRRLLRFDYRSPGNADGLPRRHTVQPWHLLFDTTRKHLYLEAYCIEVDDARWAVAAPAVAEVSPGRILAEGIELLPDKFGAVEPKRPRFQLEYLLAPEIARLGEITRHFDNMQVHGVDEQGWTRVTATTDDLFRAVRLLLGYAHNCKVVGGSEARREMVAAVRALGRVYEPGAPPSLAAS